MRASVVSFASGAVFAVGLAISGMTQPGKVTAFLDFTGHWDASLMFVMAGAIFVYSIGYRLSTKRKRPIFLDSFHIPTLRKVDRPLALGSAIFGVGWGLAGFCPGPALTSLVSLQFEPILFVFSMLAGMSLFEWNQRRSLSQ